MKISEMIDQLNEAMKWNGDQELVVMIYGKPFNNIELNAEGDTLYIEGYVVDNDNEDLFLRQYVIHNNEWV